MYIKASLSQNASCTGCRPEAVARPSTLRISFALDVDGERRAGVDRPAVDNHRARAARAPVAPALVACQVRPHAQRIEQRRPRLNRQVELLSVHHQANGHVAGPTALTPPACASASAGEVAAVTALTTPAVFRK